MLIHYLNLPIHLHEALTEDSLHFLYIAGVSTFIYIAELYVLNFWSLQTMIFPTDFYHGGLIFGSHSKSNDVLWTSLSGRFLLFL